MVSSVTDVYNSVVQWTMNIFRFPYGRVGKEFILELSRMFWKCANGFMLEAIALKVAMIIPSLLLHRPHHQSKLKENLCCLKRRLLLWKDGSISELLLEGQSIQDRPKPLKTLHAKQYRPAITCTFANLVMQDKIKSAIRLLDDASAGGILRATDLC